MQLALMPPQSRDSGLTCITTTDSGMFRVEYAESETAPEAV